MRLQQPSCLSLQYLMSLAALFMSSAHTHSPVTEGQRLLRSLHLAVVDIVTVVEDLQTTPMPKLSPSLGFVVIPQPFFSDLGVPA